MQLLTILIRQKKISVTSPPPPPLPAEEDLRYKRNYSKLPILREKAEIAVAALKRESLPELFFY